MGAGVGGVYTLIEEPASEFVQLQVLRVEGLERSPDLGAHFVSSRAARADIGTVDGLKIPHPAENAREVPNRVIEPLHEPESGELAGKSLLRRVKHVGTDVAEVGLAEAASGDHANMKVVHLDVVV